MTITYTHAKLDQLMKAVHDSGYVIAIHSWRDQPTRSMVYELWDITRSKSAIRVSDEMLARAYHPDDIVYDAVCKLLEHYFHSALKQREAWRAVRLLAEARMELERLKASA